MLGRRRLREEQLQIGRYRIAVRLDKRPGVELACQLKILDSRGNERLSFAGFNASIVSTDVDLDNDGDPDVLVEIDEGGGNRCCPIQHVIALDTSARESWKVG